MSGMVIDNIIVCLYKSLELAETDADKEAIRGSVASLLQSVLFMAEARLQYDVKKNKEEAVEMISSAGNLISDSVAAVASMLTPVPGAKTRVMVPVVKNILSSQAIQGGFFAHLLSAKKKQEIIDEKIKEHNTMLENLFATFDRYYDLIGPSIQIHGVLSRYIKQLTEQFRETQYKEIESYTTQFTRQVNSMMDEVSTSVKASLGNSMYERVAKGVIGAVAAIANANKKPETLDFNEVKHLSSTLHSRYDALEDKLNLAQKEIEAKEQGLKDAGIFQRSLKSDLAKKIEQLKKEVNKIEKELIDLKEKKQIVDNIIEPVSHKIEEYSANLSRIAERYAIN
jgi:chromosome segregation ATPase